MKKLKHLKKICTGIVCSSLLFCTACSSGNLDEYEFDKLGGGDSSSVTIEEIDNSETQTGISSSTLDTKANISDKQIATIATGEYSSCSLKSKVDDAGTEYFYYEIASAGDYSFSGVLEYPIIAKKNLGEVHLYFEDVLISADSSHIESEGKVLNSKSGTDLIVTLVGDNFISNTGNEANAIKCGGNLTINGSGTLSIISTKSAINCDGVFYGFGGELVINSGAHGVSADSIYLSGININIESCKKDGLHAESDYDDMVVDDDYEVPTFSYSKGFIFIEGETEVNIANCYGDGIQGDSYVYIDSGIINISTIATWTRITATESGMSGCFSYSNGTYTKVASDSVKKGSSYYQMEESCKAIKVGEIDYTLKDDANEYVVESSDYTILIKGGSLNLDSADDAIHANSGSVYIEDGLLNISTFDDAVHGDLNLIVSGGSIAVSSSYEGLEAQAIEISGGTIVVTATDDGINAADNDLSASVQKTTCQILISGGKTYVNSSGDGVDSNGGILIKGGELYVYGPTSGADASIDSESGIVINGGIVIAVGASGMVETPSTSSSQKSIAINFSSSKTGDISIESNGTTLASFSPSSIWNVSKSYQSVVISCPELESGVTYTVKTGSTSSSVSTNSSSSITQKGPSVGGQKRF